jgi:hypothetical protein
MNNLKTIDFGDGDDGTTGLENVSIKPVANGYVVTYSSDEGDEEFVYTNKKEMMLAISKEL